MGNGFLERAGLLPANMNGNMSGWASRLVDLLAPYVDKLEQLPQRAGIVFHFDAKKAIAAPENAEVFASPKSAEVIQSFARRALAESAMTPEQFNTIINEVKAETGTKGKDLFHPVRVALIGTHSGPAFDKLVPLIEEGSRLQLPVHVKSVRERLQEFTDAMR
jgi:glutamyl-tRNA synthetase/nondiscriminating glutamyl-tRNA synthetase